MPSFMFWVWLGLMVVAIIIELINPSDLICIWFAGGCLIALIFALILPNLIWLQIVVCIVTSVICILLTRKLSKKLKNAKDARTNVDALPGMEGKVTIDIEPHEIGEVKVDGKLWSAIADEKIEKDSYITVLEVVGVKLKVKKLEDK